MALPPWLSRRVPVPSLATSCARSTCRHPLNFHDPADPGRCTLCDCDEFIPPWPSSRPQEDPMTYDATDAPERVRAYVNELLRDQYSLSYPVAVMNPAPGQPPVNLYLGDLAELVRIAQEVATTPEDVPERDVDEPTEASTSATNGRRTSRPSDPEDTTEFAVLTSLFRLAEIPVPQALAARAVQALRAIPAPTTSGWRPSAAPDTFTRTGTALVGRIVIEARQDPDGDAVHLVTHHEDNFARPLNQAQVLHMLGSVVASVPDAGL